MYCLVFVIFDVLCFRKVRVDYRRRRSSAVSDPDSYMSVILDGMDQNKTNVPSFMQRDKAVEQVAVRVHLTGMY